MLFALMFMKCSFLACKSLGYDLINSMTSRISKFVLSPNLAIHCKTYYLVQTSHGHFQKAQRFGFIHHDPTVVYSQKQLS